jgi:hypothetical protein
MGDKEITRAIDQLRVAASSGEVQAFGEIAVQVLVRDPVRWMQTIRIQRLVERFRNAGGIRQLQNILSDPKSTPGLDANTRTQILHHIDICEFMQEVFATIDAQTQLATPAGLSQRGLYLSVIRMLEVAHWAFQENANRIISRNLKSLPNSQELASWERRIRDAMDVGLIILNSPLGKANDNGEGTITDPELNRLVELAYQYEEMRQSIDLYTYRGGTANIKRKSIVFKHADPEADAAGAVAAERIGDQDRTRQTLLLNFEVELRKALSSGPKGQRFVDFLSKNDALSHAPRFIRARSGDYFHEISRYFEIESPVTTKCGTFSIRDLARGWAFLAFLAVAGQEWNRGRPETEFRANPIVRLPQGYMTLLLSRQLGVGHRKARSILEQFTTVPGRGRVDLFYKPLVQLDRKELIIATPFVFSSRFERNIFTIIVTESELDQKKKGFLPIRSLSDSFSTAGYLSTTDYNVRAQKIVVTDIDLVAFRKGYLFLGQAKIVIEPDSSYDHWKAEEKLRHAATQLRECIDHIDDIKIDLLKKLGATADIVKVVPFIITNTRQFTERRFSGYPVIDVPYLNFLLHGATGTVIQPQPGPPLVASWKSFINGDFPTEEELDRLIHATIHRVQERGVIYKHELRKIGDRKIHLPMMRLKSSGVESIAVLRDEEPDYEVESLIEKSRAYNRPPYSL